MGTKVIRRKHIIQPTGFGACSSTYCQWDGEKERNKQQQQQQNSSSKWWIGPIRSCITSIHPENFMKIRWCFSHNIFSRRRHQVVKKSEWYTESACDKSCLRLLLIGGVCPVTDEIMHVRSWRTWRLCAPPKVVFIFPVAPQLVKEPPEQHFHECIQRVIPVRNALLSIHLHKHISFCKWEYLRTNSNIHISSNRGYLYRENNFVWKKA